MQVPNTNDISAALSRCRTAFVGVAALSGLVNVLYLTGSFFMLEVYDRVIPSRSVPTLLGLAVLAFVLYIFQGLLDAVRTRILARIGSSFDESLSERVFDIVVRARLAGREDADGLLPLRDLDQIRSYLSGPGPGAMFDLPWVPFYLIICGLFHPLIGIVAFCGLIVLVAFTAITDWMTHRRIKTIGQHAMRRNALADASRRNAEVLVAMGMQQRFARRWSRINDDYMAGQLAVSDVSSSFGQASKAFRAALQSGVLGLGAWLVINNMASSGVIIASSILVARALAPGEMMIANWKGFVQARQAWRRLGERLTLMPAIARPHALPAPMRSLSCESISVVPPGADRVVVSDLSFVLHSGQGLGVIGPSASGKSSLVRAIVSAWPCIRGKIRLDGAALDRWSSDDLGPHIGFLPQEVELFAGTIAENIARFDPNATAERIVAAAQSSGVHELILRLPEGYDTRIGDSGIGLSAGQRQRVGLARALYGDPFLVVLDEPNSNLDHEGENALTQAIMRVRERGGICVVVAHRPSVLTALDTVMLMTEGRAQAFGPKDEVLKRVLRPAPAADHAGEAAQPLVRPPVARQGAQVPGALTLQESA